MMFDIYSWGKRVGNLYLAQQICIYVHNTKYTKIKARFVNYAKGFKKKSFVPGY